MKKKKTLFSRLTDCYLLLLLLFIYLPILYVVVFSFNESKSLTNFTGFSLRWYRSMMEDKTMRSWSLLSPPWSPPSWARSQPSVSRNPESC